MLPAAASLRLSRRLAFSVGATAGLWASMELDRAVHSPDLAEDILQKWVWRWARAVVRSLEVEVDAAGAHVEGGGRYPRLGDNGKGRLFVMNHRSAIDIFLTFLLTEGHLVSRHDLAGWPFVGQGAQRLGTLFVDRASMRSGASVLKLMARSLDRGLAISIYPEGTAYDGDEVRAFRAGAFRAAQMAQAEVVPIGIAYDDPAAYYRDETFPDHVRRVVALPRLRAALSFGEPLSPVDMTLTELRDAAQAAVQKQVHRSRARLG
jgi:1-acyl-sn-glycerol-3-phosphate acyltransferase